VTLIPPDGSITSQSETGVTFSKSTDFIDNVTNT